MSDTPPELFEKELRNGIFLLVESNGALRRGIKRALKECGVGQVLEAESLKDAIVSLRASDQIRVVICAEQLDGGSGYKVLKAIAAEKKFEKTTTLLMSDNGETENLQKAIALGAHGYIVKPFAFLEIKGKVEGAVNVHQQRLAMQNLQVPVNVPIQLKVEGSQTQGTCLTLAKRWCEIQTEEPCGFGARLQMRLPVPGQDNQWFDPISGSVSSTRKGDNGEAIAKVEFTGKPIKSQGIGILLQKHLSS